MGSSLSTDKEKVSLLTHSIVDYDKNKHYDYDTTQQIQIKSFSDLVDFNTRVKGVCKFELYINMSYPFWMGSKKKYKQLNEEFHKCQHLIYSVIIYKWNSRAMLSLTQNNVYNNLQYMSISYSTFATLPQGTCKNVIAFTIEGCTLKNLKITLLNLKNMTKFVVKNCNIDYSDICGAVDNGALKKLNSFTSIVLSENEWLLASRIKSHEYDVNFIVEAVVDNTGREFLNKKHISKKYYEVSSDMYIVTFSDAKKIDLSTV